MLETFTIAMMLCALAPTVLFCVNLRRYRTPQHVAAGSPPLPTISVLIPARDEEGAIGAAVASVLASTGLDFEVVVMDDHSTDRTAAIVKILAASDSRVRLEQAPNLPTGWNGKQHACWALAHVARNELLCFVDADVRLEPEALSRMAALLVRGQRGLVSGFPRQVTETWMEWLLLPLIHFVLLGFLPVERMRRTTDPSFAAGCGQFMLVRAADYFTCGGHEEIKATMHDGLLLPKLFRQRGFRTDLADLTSLATCRMYRDARQVWFGLAKNATEGIAAPVRILPISVLLVMGQILPFVFAAWFALRGGLSLAVWIYLMVGMAGAWLPRFLAAIRFRQSWRGAILHPFGIAALLAVQWYALSRKLMGGAVSWKDRAYAGE
jgi:glycosyltransferase involved in cell wall biosynthesis